MHPWEKRIKWVGPTRGQARNVGTHAGRGLGGPRCMVGPIICRVHRGGHVWVDMPMAVRDGRKVVRDPVR